MIPSVALPFAAVLYIAESITTGDSRMDRFGIRYRLALRSLVTFGPVAATNLAIPRALMSIVHNESNGDPANYLGDTTLSHGPSVGPMQIYRKTAEDYGLWTAATDNPAGEYEQLASDEGQGIAWGVTVFKRKYDEHGGDIQAALTAYNGSGPAADDYATKAMGFMASTWNQDIPAAGGDAS